MTDLAQARLQTVRDPIRLEVEPDRDAVIAAFAHPRHELYGSGHVFDGEAVLGSGGGGAAAGVVSCH